MSLQNTSLPALLMFAGAWMFAVVPVDAVVVLEAFLPPPPQPAERATTSASKASPDTVEIFWRCMVVLSSAEAGRHVTRSGRWHRNPSPRSVPQRRRAECSASEQGLLFLCPEVAEPADAPEDTGEPMVPP